VNDQPETYELSVEGERVAPGRGVVAAYVPAAAGFPALTLIGPDPRHEPEGEPQQWLPAVIADLATRIDGETNWAAFDRWGRFFDVKVETSVAAQPMVSLQKFATGAGMDGLLKAFGAPAETALAMLATLVDTPRADDHTPSMQDFLDAIQAHENLPAPGALFRKVDAAAADGDIKAMASAIQLDPVISATLINYANSAQFASSRKTASVLEAAQRLGSAFVRRVVFVAEMMVRYQKGACKEFDYQAYWLNAIATGAAMRGLMEDFGLPARQADDAFTAGLVSGIGWLAAAETFPALMTRYLEQVRNSDPIVKARAQSGIFPCPIRRVTELYLDRYNFPETIRWSIMGGIGEARLWYDCLAKAVRIAQGLAFFECQPFPAASEIPPPCREEWQRWQSFMAPAGAAGKR